MSSVLPITEIAPAKINLCLYLGPTRGDGRHELVTLFDALTFGDELTVTPALADTVECPAISGPNLVTDALAALRDAGWGAPPVRVEIDKRIPIAAGMGGGSADAAALLRLAPTLAPVAADTLVQIATALGADVPSQLAPGLALGTGAGEQLQPLDALAPYGVLVLPQAFALSTAAVYRECDRLGLGRSAEELDRLAERVRLSAAERLDCGLIANDMQPAALSLAPQIGGALDTAVGAGADRALVCGSGPTVIGLFWGADGPQRARDAAASLAGTTPAPLAATQVLSPAGVRFPAANR